MSANTRNVRAHSREISHGSQSEEEESTGEEGEAQSRTEAGSRVASRASKAQGQEGEEGCAQGSCQAQIGKAQGQGAGGRPDACGTRHGA
jgi:hypothetical protein